METPIKLIRKNSREMNEAVQSRVLWEAKEIKALRESFKAAHNGVDMIDAEKFPAHMPEFFAKAKAKLQEADSGSSFSQVLRAGVQAIVNRMYEQVPTSHEDWVHVVQSTKDTELYAPLHGLSFLREIGKQEMYPEARAAGLDLKIKNRKYGTHYSIEKELLEDDQTGQFSQQVGVLGEYAKLALEVLVMAKLASVSGAKYAELEIPTTETKPDDEATYPWSTALVGGGANRPAAFGAPTQANIQAGFIAMMNQKNKLGLKMMVEPKRILISPKYKFDIATLLNSAFYASVPSAVAGATGTNYAVNTMQGLLNPTISRFMFDHTGAVDGTSKAWYLMDDSKPWFVLQLRQAAEVLQENPSSGQSFDRDVIRFKVSLRANADFVDPRFGWQGNDGSV